MESDTFPNIWYASDKKFNSPGMIGVVFDDKGSLDVTATKILFRGQKATGELERKTITKVFLVRRKTNWIGLLLIYILLFVVFIASHINLALTILIMLGFFVFRLLVMFGSKWICVESKKSNGELEKMFLADGSNMGWGGIFGGTAKLFRILTK